MWFHWKKTELSINKELFVESDIYRGYVPSLASETLLDIAVHHNAGAIFSTKMINFSKIFDFFYWKLSYIRSYVVVRKIFRLFWTFYHHTNPTPLITSLSLMQGRSHNMICIHELVIGACIQDFFPFQEAWMPAFTCYIICYMVVYHF